MITSWLWGRGKKKAEISGRQGQLRLVLVAGPGSLVTAELLLAFGEDSIIGMWMIIPIALAVRRLPYTVQGTFLVGRDVGAAEDVESGMPPC